MKPSNYIFSRDQIRELDRLAIEEYHIPSIVLMENASRGVADHALIMLPSSGRVLILCGPGNNGGDGLAAARHLHNAGVDVTIVLLRPPSSYTGDAAVNLRIVQTMKLHLLDASGDPLPTLRPLGPTDLVIDGLFGTGLTNDVRQPFLDVIAWINNQPSPILSIDIPSGLDCDTGQPMGTAVRATETVTFVGLKKGFLTPGADAYTGIVHIADIGAPRELTETLGMLG